MNGISTVLCTVLKFNEVGGGEMKVTRDINGGAITEENAIGIEEVEIGAATIGRDPQGAIDLRSLFSRNPRNDIIDKAFVIFFKSDLLSFLDIVLREALKDVLALRRPHGLGDVDI